jgi:peptidoglycan hydrolase CwlO-like protein
MSTTKQDKLSVVGEGIVGEVSDYIQGLEEDVARLDNEVVTLECRLEEAEINNDKLLTDIEELREYIQELETALAEAHLMSKEESTK